MKLSTAHLSVVGPRRRTNEDRASLQEGLNLYLVADGTGSIAPDGTQPSELSIQSIVNYLRTKLEEAPAWPFQISKGKSFHTSQLRVAMKLASEIVHKKEQEEEDIYDFQGFSSSLVALWFVEDSVLVTHAGDCRAYRIREKEIEAFTEDHTLLQDYVQMRRLSPEEIKDFPHKNVLTRWVGQKDLQVAIEKKAVQKGDVYLLCTDGLHENVTNEEVLRIIQDTESLQDACEKLIASATQNPRCDNCTAVLVRVEA